MGKMRPDGRYVATVRINGKRTLFYSRKSYAHAKALADAARLEAGQTPRPIQALSDPSTFASFVYGVYVPRTYEDARNTTKHKYDGQLRHHILPSLGHLPIASIGYDEMAALKASLRRRNKDGQDVGELASRTKREIIMRAREIMNLFRELAEGRGQRVRTDWKVVKPPPAARKKKRTEPEEDFTVRLLRHADGHWMQGPLFCALFLGLRRGEVCGLRWDAIDRKNLRLEVDEQRHPLLGPGAAPKGDERTIPVPQEIVDVLDALGDHDSTYVFTMEVVQGGRRRVPILENEVSKAAPELVMAAGLARRTFHDLRAFLGSNLTAIGADPITVMEILGHAKLDTTMLYLDGREKNKRAAIEGLVRGFLTPDLPAQTSLDHHP